MRNKNNNNGSVLILVVLVIGVLSVIGTSVLSAALSNYKMKITSSALKTNLYLTEAGFEETYEKIYKIVTLATKEANRDAIKNLKGYYSSDLVYTEYNEVTFNNAVLDISENPEHIILYPYITKGDLGEYIFNDLYIEEQAKKAFTNTYIWYLKQHLSSITDYEGRVNCSINPLVNVYIKKKINDTFVVLDNNLIFYGEEGKKRTTIYLQSSYNDDKAQRKADVVLDIYVPNYNEPYSVTIEGKQLKVNPLWTKVIATDTDIVLNGKTNIIGSIYAGDDVNIKNDCNISKNIISRSDLLIDQDNITVNTADIYCDNIYLKGSNIFFHSSGEDEYMGLYIKDDFEMNNIEQNVVIDNNYYGFSDGSDGANNSPDNSSGININSDDINTKSSFTLNGDLYLYGTSYIKGLAIPYQTGESISVKGNYIAYSMPLLDNEFYLSEDKVSFEYIDPLTLVIKKSNGENLSVFDKNKYFFQYNKELNEGKNTGKLSLDNINISNSNKIVTLGDVITSNATNKVQMGNFNIGDHADLFDKYKNIHCLKTKALGDKYISGVNEDVFPNNFIINCPEISIKNDVKFEGDDEPNNSFENIYRLEYIKDNTNLNIKLSGGETKYYFVVTNGSVNINGDGNIVGCIIAKNGVNINGNINLIYNERIILNAFSDNEWLLKKFKQYDTALLKNYTSSSKVKIDNDDQTIMNIDYTDLLKFRNWKINYEN